MLCISATLFMLKYGLPDMVTAKLRPEMRRCMGTSRILAGSMNMTEWGQVDVNPVGKDDHDKAYEKPTELTMQRMRNASQLAREYELYDYARELFECKLRACGIAATTQRKALDVALEVWAT